MQLKLWPESKSIVDGNTYKYWRYAVLVEGLVWW